MSNVVKAILDASSSVTNDLANGASSIKHLRETQGEAPPYIVLESNIVDPNDTNSGQTLDEWEVNVSIVSKWLYDESPDKGATTIAKNVRAALHDVSGTYSSESVNKIVFRNQLTPQNFNTTSDQRVQLEQTYTMWINR